MMKGTVETFNSSTLFSDAGWDIHYPHLIKAYHFTFRTPEQATNVAAHIALFCELNNHHVELGLNEIFLNAIEHGNLEITAQEKTDFKNMIDWQNKIYERLKEPKNLNKKVKVTVEMTPDYVSFEITDQGKGFLWETVDYTHATPRKRTGRGLLLASKLCFDKIEFLGKGNVVRCLCWRV